MKMYADSKRLEFNDYEKKQPFFIKPAHLRDLAVRLISHE